MKQTIIAVLSLLTLMIPTSKAYPDGIILIQKPRSLTIKPLSVSFVTINKMAELPVAPPVALDCGDNSYANYIYMHESGCNPSALNAEGCRGIGQACPGSKLPCAADYACQNAYFTAYAVAAYGGWLGAYNHWLAYSWW